MATVSVAQATHGTLTANTVETVNLSAQKDYIKVTNFHATALMYVTSGAYTTATSDPHYPATPTVAGANTRVVPAVGASIYLHWPTAVLGGGATVLIISGSTNIYSVEAVSAIGS